MGYCGRVGMGSSLFSCPLFVCAFGPINTLLIPGLPRVRLCRKILTHVTLDVRVCAWIACLLWLFITGADGIIYVVSYLPPGIEYYLFVGVVGMQGSNHSPDRIVKQNGAYTLGSGKLKTVGRTEKRLVLPDRFALIVKNSPARTDPARVCMGRVRIVEIKRPRLGSAWIFF